MTLPLLRPTHVLDHPVRLHWPKQLSAIYRESRPGVQLVFLLRSIASSAVLTHPTLRAERFVLGWVCITVAIYVFNGVTDVVADSANGSARPIATHQLGVSSALSACAALAGAGLLACASVNFAEALAGGAMLVLGWAYSAGPQFKNAPAGFALVIGAGAALTYTAGWVARGTFDTSALLVAGWVSCWVCVCCASKDFSDVDGDRLAGRRTWPVLFGPRRAAILLSVLALATAAAFTTTSIETSAGSPTAAIVLAGSIMLALIANIFASASARIERRLPYRAFMATQYAANLSMMIFANG